MGLFDMLARQAVGSFSGNQSGLLTDMLEQAGGLQGLAQRFHGAGLGAHFDSWVAGNTDTEPLQAGHVHSVFGVEHVQAMAGKIGLDPQMVAGLMAQFLPNVINKLTPENHLNGPAPSPELLQNLAGEIMKDGLAAFFGRR